MMACPYGIPRYDWDKPVPYIKKCILCYDNIKSGKISEPACTAACPVEATVYGERKDLLKEARKRIKSEPGKYMDKIYGEFDVGGTNVMYVTAKDCPLDFMIYYNNRIGKDVKLRGLPPPDQAIPLTTKWAMGAVPFAFLGMGAIMSGLYWVINRRRKVDESENNNEAENTKEAEDGKN
jgi:formate dehydrogenase iron-sulfur subunit